MNGKVWLVAIMALALGCVVLVAVNLRMTQRLSDARAELAVAKRAADDLENRARGAESERDSLNRGSWELRQELASLHEQRKEDSLVIEAIWRGLRPGGRGTGQAVRYDGEAIRKLLKSSDNNLDAVLRQILTPDGIAATLERHSGDPNFWAAAAFLSQDSDTAINYLEEAARLYPKSPVVLSSLVEALMANGQFDEATMARIAQLKELDPANSLPDYYDAHCRFQNRDIQGALQSLAEASVKDRLADNTMDLLVARYNYLLNAGCSDSAAMGMAAFTLPLSHMGMLRNVGRSSLEQAGLSFSAGQWEESLRITDSVLRTGRNLSSSGRFLIHDLVGIALQESALNEQRRVYEALGNTAQLVEIDAWLQAIKERASLIKVMATASGDVFQNMSEDDLANYVESTIRNGEFSTLRDMPGVAEAMERARSQPQ